MKILTQLTVPSVCSIETHITDQLIDTNYLTRSKSLNKNKTARFGSGKYAFEWMDKDLAVFAEIDALDNDVGLIFKLAKEEEKRLEKEVETNYFGCSDLDIIPRTRKKVEENQKGNRGVSFLRIRIDGETIPVVLKEANR